MPWCYRFLFEKGFIVANLIHNQEYLQVLKQISALSPRVKISKLNTTDELEFLKMTNNSKSMHAPWGPTPQDAIGFADLLERNKSDNFETVVVRPPDDDQIIGIFNLSQIFRKHFQNTILGCYANINYAGQGYMREGLLQTIAYAFFELKLHRIEANIICSNTHSIKFFQSCGFRHEGMSKNYLYINDAWQDHDKYALTVEDCGGR